MMAFVALGLAAMASCTDEEVKPNEEPTNYAELLVGTWDTDLEASYTDETVNGETTHVLLSETMFMPLMMIFSEDGKLIIRNGDTGGIEYSYTVEGNQITSSLNGIETVYTILSLNERRLVMEKSRSSDDYQFTNHFELDKVE